LATSAVIGLGGGSLFALICPLKTDADVLTKLLKHCRIPDPNRS
jgi:hypothetical protein